MATAKQIVALLNSHLEGDSEQFLSIALQVAAAESRQGRRETAEELKRLIDKARERSIKVQDRPVVALVRPKGELESVLSASYPRTKLDDMVLRSRVRAPRPSCASTTSAKRFTRACKISHFARSPCWSFWHGEDDDGFGHVR
jgi:hypothetical protein